MTAERSNGASGKSTIEETLSDIETEAERLRGTCRRKKLAFRIAHYTVGGSAAVLAGAASVSALQEAASSTVAVLAGLAGALSAMQLFLRPAENAEFHKSRQIKWERLAHEIRDFRNFDLRALDDAAAREALRKYRHEFDVVREATEGSPP